MVDLEGWSLEGGNKRGLKVFLVSAFAVALLGFLVGVRQTAVEIEGLTQYAAPEHEPSVGGGVIPARSYGELMERPLESNSHWAGSIDRLSEETTLPLLDELENPEENKEQSLRLRAERRAYAGAPPVVPHPVKQRSDSSCLACHREGVTIRGFLAPPMSHEHVSQCTQCHVVSDAPVPGGWPQEYLLSTENTFAGLAEPRDGERAWPGAPATIPHSTQMRTNCMSCHGLNGREGLRSSHPWRDNCMQCHAPSAVLDQRAPLADELAPIER